MIAQATTRIDVFRDAAADTPDPTDEATDEWGNPIETDRPDGGDTGTEPDPYLSNIAASIVERTMRSPDPTTGDPRTVRYVVGKVGNGTDVRAGDIVVDRMRGGRYRVTGWSEPQNVAMRLDRRLDLERTDSDSTYTPPESGYVGLGQSPLGGLP